jgi:hypothetical protein
MVNAISRRRKSALEHDPLSNNFQINSKIDNNDFDRTANAERTTRPR